MAAMHGQERIPQGLGSHHDHRYDIATTRPYAYPITDSHSDNAFRGATTTLSHQDDGTLDDSERHSKTSQRSDDSFSAYIEHPVRQSTPLRANHVHAAKGSLEDVLIRNRSRESTHGVDSIHSRDSEEADEDYGEASWPTTVDHEEEKDEKSSVPHGSIIIPEMELNDEDEGDMEAGGEKKRRRRTNKAEATVLASVFSQTQFPDAQTREALAQRLNMKPKAVSIWFQNRRQAMKKRASRFGGVEGVNGPTVTASAIQVLDVGPHRAPQCDTTDLSTERLKRWMSLDDVISAELNDSKVDVLPIAKLEGDIAVESKLSSAPILDFIRKQRGQHQLSRMASMPSLASLISTKQDVDKVPCHQKDLRDLLPSNSVPSLHRRKSASSLLAHQHVASPVLKQSLRERCFSLQMSNEGRAAVADPAIIPPATDSSSANIGRVTFPDIVSKMLQKHGGTELERMESIWKRMQSSSSASDSCADSSDKENRDPNLYLFREDGEEDEERTLRLIAGKRAARELAKKEKMLSEEGRRYVEEADARMALQQRKRPSLSSIVLGANKGKALKSSSANRKWNRAVSEAQVKQRNALGLIRVPSLDLTAGRDRSKDDGRPSFRSVSEMRLAAKRPFAISYDENHPPGTTLQARLSQQQKKRARHSHSTSMDMHTQTKAPHPYTPFQSRRPDQSLLRRYASATSLPTPALSLLSSRIGAVHSFTSIPGTARESSARLDGAQPISSSQESSENGSDDWLEAWAQEKTTASEAASTLANVLQDRSSVLNTGSATKLPVARHDDSGFYGSDSGDEESGRSSKRRLVSQGSSSPSKRGGDDRDRLAAETLLGLGTRS